ncbi:hypothetical protein CIG19_06010 [Enterobacterales bacterium CwR94]|nr:hypothetical protein CIG19_06010 [Enterobacterales bacterium CwR94]
MTFTGLLFSGLLLLASPARAMDCLRATTLIENSICSQPQLLWLDRVLTDSYIKMIAQQPQRLETWRKKWIADRNACASNTCIRRAYLQGISDIYQSDHQFDWSGEWWNSSAPNGSGGRLMISQQSEWGFKINGEVWAGVNRGRFSGDANRWYGIWLVNNIPFASGCSVLLMPRTDGKVEVSSNDDGHCRLLAPQGITVDGTYVRAEEDPRPAPTLLSLGILPNAELDKAFRELTGSEYQAYVDTANSFVYSNDLDEMGATVLTLWVKGAANKQAAVIMYTQDHQIWAMRAFPDEKRHVRIHYLTTEKSGPVPKTLAGWRSVYDDTQDPD